ncbi:fructosamine kinase family protein [Flavobacteriaceae bacterium S0862]|nr:fructosamine kinase family protein [Flavobacteriaceae bacterium S0862]
MFNKDFISHLTSRLESKILSYKSISRGDISSAYHIKTQNKDYFLKINSNKYASSMFIAEREGLDTIAKANAIATPKVYFIGSFKNYSYIIMEYLEATTPTPNAIEKFGKQLAQLHQTKTEEFGFGHNNFIGSLHQLNSYHNDWHSFYINKRLLPQINLAISKGFLSENEVPNIIKMQSALDYLFKNVTPSLLHGDLWNGNFLITTNDVPYLIDPASYYGHSEVDIAMSKLFGGFSSGFYNAYHNIIPQDEDTNTRVEIYQLYYLLVHLNLFGRSYYSSVKSILSKYF